MVSLAEISKVLAAHPGVRRAETVVVCHEGRDVIVAAAELCGYVSGPILRDHVRRELGGDSLSALGIIAAVEAEFGRTLDVYEFMSAASVRRLAEILR